MATDDDSSSKVIEISDSSDSESESSGEDNDTTSSEESSSRTGPPTLHEESAQLTYSDVESSHPSTDPNKTKAKRTHNRRKSVHQTRKCTDELVFEPVAGGAGRVPNRASKDDKNDPKVKNVWSISSINDAIEGDLDDPETMRLLQKIAYCRVFSNYLFRQYDMSAIDYKLYSNVDLLMLELKKRADTYSTVRKNRQKLVKDGSGEK